MKKRVMWIFILGFFILLIGMGFVSAGLCKGSDGYYHDCDDVYVSNYKQYDTYKEQRAYNYGYKDGYEYGFWNGYRYGYDERFYVKDYNEKYYDEKVYVKGYDDKKYYVVYDNKYKKVKSPEYYVYTWSHREDCPSGWVCYEWNR